MKSARYFRASGSRCLRPPLPSPGAAAYTYIGYAGREALAGSDALIQHGLVALALIAALLLTRPRVPPLEEPVLATGTARPFAAIARRPAYLVALFCAATGYGVTILAMTATPLAMLQHHHGLAEAASVIQLHVLGMFLPSFFTGALISRFGTLNVMVAGIAVLALHVLTTLTGTGFGSFAGALLLVLLPWLAAAFVAILALGFLGLVSARIKA